MSINKILLFFGIIFAFVMFIMSISQGKEYILPGTNWKNTNNRFTIFWGIIVLLNLLGFFSKRS